MTVYVVPADGQFVLWCSDGRSRDMPAGPRLFRAPPHPDIKFSHHKREDAQRDAVTLQAYIAETHSKKQSKADLRKVSL